MLVLLLPLQLGAQEAHLSEEQVDSVQAERYMPIVSFSSGVLNFRGDVRNQRLSPSVGLPGYSLSLSTEIRRWPFLYTYFYFMKGQLGGLSVELADPLMNANFKTDLTQIGLDLEYRFDHLVPSSSMIRPYVRLGIGALNFSAKGDLEDAGGNTYYYWGDGSLRTAPQDLDPGAGRLYRDHIYETDLRLHEQTVHGLGDYNQRAMVIPLGIGAHFKIVDRVSMSMGLSYNFALTDMIDNVAAEGTSIVGDRGNDRYVFSQVTVYVDLLNTPTRIRAQEWYDDFEAMLIEDEDQDLVVDMDDHCPGTPFRVEVDSLGCALDEDGDGVPDYADLEPGTAQDAWVDELGQTVSEEAWLAAIAFRERAMERENVEAYLSIIEDQYQFAGSVEIPEKFRSLDEDGDGYISFDELLLAIDQYFDFELELDTEEVRELNEFFFAQ